MKEQSCRMTPQEREIQKEAEIANRVAVVADLKKGEDEMRELSVIGLRDGRRRGAPRRADAGAEYEAEKAILELFSTDRALRELTLENAEALFLCLARKMRLLSQGVAEAATVEDAADIIVKRSACFPGTEAAGRRQGRKEWMN